MRNDKKFNEEKHKNLYSEATGEDSGDGEATCEHKQPIIGVPGPRTTEEDVKIEGTTGRVQLGSLAILLTTMIMGFDGSVNSQLARLISLPVVILLL